MMEEKIGIIYNVLHSKRNCHGSIERSDNEDGLELFIK